MTTEATAADNDPDDPDVPAIGADDGPDDAPELDDDLPDPASRPRLRGRSISQSVREAFTRHVKPELQRAKAAGELGDDDDLVPAIGADEPPPAKPAPAAAEKPAEPAAPAPAASPPAPSLDPKVLEAHERLNLRAADLDRRERELEERGRAGHPADELRARFHDDPAGTIVDLVREWAGVAKDAPDSEVRDLFSDLLTDLGGRTLGLGVSPEVQARTEARRALRALKAHKTEALKAEEQHRKDAEAESRRSERTRAISTLGKELQAKANAYPHLAVTDEPGAIVMDVIEARHRQDGTVMRWEDAAALADKYLKDQADQWFAKRRHLYATAPAEKPVQPTPAASVSQGGPPDHRRSQTLTNGHAAARPTPPVEPDAAEMDQEASRRASLRKLRAAIDAKRKPAE